MSEVFTAHDSKSGLLGTGHVRDEPPDPWTDGGMGESHRWVIGCGHCGQHLTNPPVSLHPPFNTIRLLVLTQPSLDLSLSLASNLAIDLQTGEYFLCWWRWSVTGAGVISVETVPLITRSGEVYFQPEVTYRRCRNPGAFQVVQVYCVHLNDNFEEPCPDKLPPLPELKSSYCCCIS